MATSSSVRTIIANVLTAILLCFPFYFPMLEQNPSLLEYLFHSLAQVVQIDIQIESCKFIVMQLVYVIVYSSNFLS